MWGGSGGHGDGGGAGADPEAAEGEEGRHREAAREREIFRVGWVGFGGSSDISRSPEKSRRRGGSEWAAPRVETEKIAPFCAIFGGLAHSWLVSFSGGACYVGWACEWANIGCPFLFQWERWTAQNDTALL